MTKIDPARLIAEAQARERALQVAIAKIEEYRLYAVIWRSLAIAMTFLAVCLACWVLA